jgi:dihydroorotase
LPAGRLIRRATADLVLFDPDAPVVVDADKLRSRARNTPFEGRKLQGRVMKTYVGGVCVYDRNREGAP